MSQMSEMSQRALMSDLFNEPFTMSKMSLMSEMLNEAMSDIMNRDNTLKYRHWRIRHIWKDYFNLIQSFDNGYTENMVYLFKSAISCHIEEMSEDETTRYLDTILKTMREVS